MTRHPISSTVPALVASFTLVSLFGAATRQRALAEHRLSVAVDSMRATPASSAAAIELASEALVQRGALAAWSACVALLERLDVAASLREYLDARRAELVLEHDAITAIVWSTSEALGASTHWRSTLRHRAELVRHDAELASIEARRDELERLEREIDRAFPRRRPTNEQIEADADACPLEYDPTDNAAALEAEIERDEGAADVEADNRNDDAAAGARVVHAIREKRKNRK